jgi:dipeptidyl aminopeptidase/acylaminoacyl peptidase
MNNRRVLAVAIILVVAIAVVWIYFLLTPEVVAFSPQDTDGYNPRSTDIEITFSQSMEAESVKARLSIYPGVAGNFTWEEEKTLRFTPVSPWKPGTEVSVQLARGAKSSLGLGIRQDSAWTFTVAPTLLAYLWPSHSEAEVYALELLSGETTQLTETNGVFSFDVDAAGQTIYFSASNQQGGSDLFVLDRFEGDATEVYSCEKDLCTDLDLSPDGAMLAFLRKDAEVWLLRMEEDQDVRVSQAGHQARLPQWSPDGQLSYYDADALAFIVQDVDTGKKLTFENQTGETGDWSPDGTVFIAPEMFDEETDILRGPTGEASNREVDETELEPVRVLASHLTAYDTDTEEITDLTRVSYVEDLSPTFSPDGRRLVFARRYLDEKRWTPGRQAWLMQVDGGDTHALTHAEDYKYIDFAWHPEGDQIAAVRFNTTFPLDPLELWLIELDGQAFRLVVGGYAPQWIP